MNETASLAFNDLAQGGSSDKVYIATLDEYAGAWRVVAQYGRRGSALASQWKAEGVSYEKAKQVFDKLVRAKLGKGYVLAGSAPAPQVAPSGEAVDVKPPELLEEVINGDHRRYVTDPAYWMQDKSDGVSRGVIKQRGEIFGINKRGLPVPLPAELVEELSRLQLETFQIDAELVGTRLICRDLLVANEDISELPYEVRFDRLAELLWPDERGGWLLEHVSFVATWRDADMKQLAIDKARAERREGVVFKLRSAPYRPGRNGQHKKYKFIKTLSAICGEPRAGGKESVDLFLHNRDDFDALVRCGTVSLIGKPAVKFGDVVEVAYLYAQPSGLLSQARLLHVRTDVEPSECVTSQLIYKREEEA